MASRGTTHVARCEHGMAGACDKCAAGLGPDLGNALGRCPHGKILCEICHGGLKRNTPPTGEVRVTNEKTGGEKGAKPEAYGLIPVRPMAAVARVYGYGAQKYAARNWEKGYDWDLSYSAAQRHMNAFWAGEDFDPETHEPHLAHAVFHMLAIMEWMETHPELDNRATTEVARAAERDSKGDREEAAR